MVYYNEKEFDNQLLREYFISNNIKVFFGTPYHLQSQGSVEAYNKTIQIFISVKDSAKN